MDNLLATHQGIERLPFAAYEQHWVFNTNIYRLLYLLSSLDYDFSYVRYYFFGALSRFLVISIML